MKQKQTKFSLFIFIILCVFVELFASYWTGQTVSTWYPTLNKPVWNPPAWVFAPVWTILYVMLAISGWLMYEAAPSRQRTVALAFYGVQLILNFIWSFFFFSLQSPFLGLIDILLLLLFVVLTIISAWTVRPLAALLLLPYVLWVLYATTLNLGIWLLNE